MQFCCLFKGISIESWRKARGKPLGLVILWSAVRVQLATGALAGPVGLDK